jgi:hypothetical protein
VSRATGCLEVIDRAGRTLPQREWIALLEEIAHECAQRIDAARDDLRRQERQT